MHNIPKFSDIFDVETLDINEMKTRYKAGDIVIPEYERNFSESEVLMFIEALKYKDLYMESDAAGNPDKILDKTKILLDDLTDGRWSKMSTAEKSAFLQNYKWDGSKFVSTTKGKIKAGLTGIGVSITNAISPKQLAPDFTASFLINLIWKSIKFKTISLPVLKTVFKATPKGMALGTFIFALLEAGSAVELNTANDKELDFASRFDSAIKTVKSNIKNFLSKLKGKK